MLKPTAVSFWSSNCVYVIVLVFDSHLNPETPAPARLNPVGSREHEGAAGAAGSRGSGDEVLLDCRLARRALMVAIDVDKGRGRSRLGTSHVERNDLDVAVVVTDRDRAVRGTEVDPIANRSPHSTITTAAATTEDDTPALLALISPISRSSS